MHRSHDVFRHRSDIYAYARHRLRLCVLRSFFGFCDFTVTCRGGVYLLRAALVAVHLFEHLKNFGCFHDRFCVCCGVWWPNDTSSATAAGDDVERKGDS